jgi:hypothetical protein
MKIDETQPNSSQTQEIQELAMAYKALKAQATGGMSGMSGFDDGDMGFFSMLTSLEKKKQGVESGALDLLSPMTGEDIQAQAAKALAENALQTTNKANDSLLNTVQGALAIDGSDAKTVKKDLEQMMGDLTPEDAAYLKTINPNGLPIAPPVPLNQLIPVDDEGKPQFDKIPASKGLSDMLEKAYKTGRPIRVELENGGSIILKIKAGKVSAEFIATDQANALYLKQQLAELKQRMESKNLPVGQLDARREERSKKQQERQPDQELEEVKQTELI